MTRRLSVLTAFALAAFVLDLRLQPGGLSVTRAVDDLTQLAAAALCALAAGWRAGRVAGRMRSSWILLGIGSGSWAVGEAVWSYYELVAHTVTPFPSLADVGFLSFPLFTGLGLVVRPSRAYSGRGWARVGLDVLLVVVSLLSLSWVTTLGETYRGGSDSKLGMVVSLAYPAGDVALLTVVVVVITYAGVRGRVSLWLLGTGLALFAVADSGFAYLTAIGDYRTGNLIDACWVGGFLLAAGSAVLDRSVVRDSVDGHLTPRSALLLPYLPAGVGVTATIWHLHVAGHDTPAEILAGITVWLLLIRQVLVLMDNRLLLQRTSHQALHDVLTGLANRALFADRLEHALALHARDVRPVSLLLIDLDDFKAVNDTLGHPAGDELLVRVSERLLGAVRASDTVARLGGDEFAILIEDDDPLRVADRVRVELEQPIPLGGRQIPVSTSIGLAGLEAGSLPKSGTDLLRRADIAMYHAKRSGKGRLVQYDPNMTDSHRHELDLRSAMAADLDAGNIDIALQLITHADGSHYGCEVLARWQHAGAAVPPSVFLPVASWLGAAARLDELVLAKAITEMRTQPAGMMLSVNLSGETLASPELADRIADILAAKAYSPSRLIVEVLESSLIEEDEAALQALHRLRELGIKIAVDDFGAGYASVARLHALQPDIVKIDRTVVWAVAADSSTSLLDGITYLAHQLGAMVVAEGIETNAQLDGAVAAGCDALQGYRIGRPELVRPVGLLPAA